MSKKATVYLTDQSLGIIGETDSLAGRINAILERYNMICRDAMPALPENEWCAICDANNPGQDVTGMPWSATILWANVADSGPDGIDEKWGVDHQDLAARMRAMPLPAQVAIHEVVRAFWASPYLNELLALDLLEKSGARVQS